MNIKKIVLILPVLLLLVTSCGYGSKSECMKEEIRKNGGKNNAAISQYCNEKFDKKSKKSRKLKSGVDYRIEYRSDFGIYLTNYSDSKIRVYKGVMATSENGECPKFSELNTSWDNEPNFLAGNLIYPGTEKKVGRYLSGRDCFYSYVSH